MNDVTQLPVRVLAQVGAFDLDVLLALAAVILGLSLAVEVIQELYKFVTTSKARAYRKALIDFVGPKVDEVLKQRSLGGMLLRGPFQFRTSQTPAYLLPADRDELVHAVERTTAPEMQAALQTLRDEALRQGGTPRSASPAVRQWFEELCEESGKSLCAQDILSHLCKLGVVSVGDTQEQVGGAMLLARDNFDAASVLDSLHTKYLPKVKTVEREFTQFATNFEFAYRRRSLRQTLVIAFLLAFFLNLPLDGLYRQAWSLSPEQVVLVAESALNLEESIQSRGKKDAGDSTGVGDAGGEAEGPGADDASDEPTEPENGAAKPPEEHGGQIEPTGDDPGQEVSKVLQDLNELILLTLDYGGEERVFQPLWAVEATMSEGTVDAIWARVRAAVNVKNLLACLATAVLLTFGAPFWHRVSAALLAVRRPSKVSVQSETEGQGGA